MNLAGEQLHLNITALRLNAPQGKDFFTNSEPNADRPRTLFRLHKTNDDLSGEV